MGYELVPVGQKSGRVRVLRTVTMTLSGAMSPAEVPGYIGVQGDLVEFWQALAEETVKKGETLSQADVEIIRARLVAAKLPVPTMENTPYLKVDPSSVVLTETGTVEK
jgi:hypothetical protein